MPVAAAAGPTVTAVATVLPATPTAYPTFIVPSEPLEAPTVSIERIAGGGAGGLLAGFVAGGAAGILYYNFTRRKIPGLPTLSDSALFNGVRWGGYGAGVLGLGIAAYAAYSSPPKPIPDIYPFLLRGPGEPAMVSRTASQDPADVALAETQSKVLAEKIGWIASLELDGERLVIRVTDAYDTVALARRREAFARVLALWNAARAAAKLETAPDCWIKGATFLELYRP